MSLDRRYTLYGEPLLAHQSRFFNAGTILCDIIVDGTLTIAGSFVISGSITGPGSVTLGGEVTYAGPRPNTYSGETVLQHGTLVLDKPGTIALPGNLRMIGGLLRTLAPAQIARSAVLSSTANADGFEINGDETIHGLQLSGGLYARVSNGAPQPVITTDSLSATGGNIRMNVVLNGNTIDVPQGQLTINSRVATSGNGVIVRGGGSLIWSRDDAMPLRIEGANATITMPNSDIELTAGTLYGSAASLHATGGSVGSGFIAAGDVRLGPDVRFAADASGYRNLQLNGVLDLGGATLDVIQPYGVYKDPIVIISNHASQPVIGTFAGLMEGAIIRNRWRVSYRGGDGNDVTLTDLLKPFASIDVSYPASAYAGEPVKLTAHLTGSASIPTGIVTFRTGVERCGVNHCGLIDIQTIGTAAIAAGDASLVWVPPAADHYFVSVEYSGDDTYTSGRPASGQRLSTTYHKPVIDSITPGAVIGGTPAALVIRGSNFRPESKVVFAGYYLHVTTTVISASEIRASIDLTSFIYPYSLDLTVVTGDASSDPLKFRIMSPPQPPAAIQFDTGSVFAAVTPHATTAWITTDPHNPWNFLADDDSDGLIRWAIDPCYYCTYAFADVATGDYSIAPAFLTDPSEPIAKPLPLQAFQRGATGAISRLTLPGSLDGAGTWNILWVRPGAGAWHMSVTDGSDDDGLLNRIITTSVAGMIPMGDSPAHPSGFQSGDTVLLTSFYTIFAGRLSDELERESPPAEMRLTREAWRFVESEKRARISLIRTGDASGEASLRYRTIDIDGSANVHYLPASGLVTFAPGQVIANAEVPLIDDALFEGTTSFDVALSDPAGASLTGTTQFTVQVNDDDPVPEVKVVGPLVRNITLSNGKNQVLQLDFELAGAAAIPIPIHSFWANTVFAPGEQRKSLLIPLQFGSVPETKIIFESPLPVKMPPTITLRIQSDPDPQWHVTLSNLVVDEHARVAHVLATSSQPLAYTAGATWRTVDGSAKSGRDYAGGFGSISFPPGQTQTLLDIPIFDNTDADGDRTFSIELNYRTQVPVVIMDDETHTRPRVSIAERATVTEGDDAAAVSLELRLSEPSAQTVTVRCATSNITANAGIDYEATDAVVTFPPGETTKSISIPIYGDTLKEGDETFAVTIVYALNGTIAPPGAQVTIADDDFSTPPPHRH
jgi:hypothetical protein